MSLRCSLLGHSYGEAEIEREREEQGSEVVVTVREFEECERCGDRKVVTENKEVTALESPAPDLESAEANRTADDSSGATGGPAASSEPSAGNTPGAGSEPNAGGGPAAGGNSSPSGSAASGGPAAGTGRTGSSQPDVQMGADATGDDAEIIGGSSESASSSGASASSGGSEANSSSAGASGVGGSDTASPSAGSDTAPPSAGSDPDQSPSAADDDGVILDDDDDSGSNAAGDGDRTPGEWPDAETTHPADADDGPGDWPAVGREEGDDGFDAGPAEGGSADVDFGGGLTPESAPEVDDDESEEVEFVNADGDTLGTRDTTATDADFSSGISAGADAPSLSGPADDPDVDAEFVCPECDYRQAVAGSSLRAGDICPECSRGYLAQE